MGRRYTVDQALAKLSQLADFNLTTDVIVGFPSGERRRLPEHAGGRRAAGFTKVHVFPYSPRPGTRTAVRDPVLPAVKRQRSARSERLSDELVPATLERSCRDAPIVS